MYKYFICLSFIFSFFSELQAQNEILSTHKIDAFIQTAYDSIGIIPGIAVGVIHNGEIAFKKTYGYSDIGRNEKLSSDSQFYIASTTKSFTALSTSLLHERGLLDLNKSIKEYFPKVSFPDSISADLITLKSLLSHTSGIDNSNISFPKSQSGIYTNKKLFDVLENTFGRVEFGEYRYSNLGYNILNLIFLKEFGKSWGEIVKEEILDPLGMNNTYYSYIQLLENNESIATNYFSLGDGENLFEIHQRQKRSDNTLHAAGGLFTNLNDIVKWVQLQTAFETPKNRKNISLEAISYTRQEIASVKSGTFGFDKEVYSYGLGWNIGKFKNNTLYFHGGGYGGHRTMISFIPELNTGVVVMTNDSFSGNGINYWVSSFIYDALLNANNSSDWSEKYYSWINSFRSEVENFALKTVRNDVSNRSSRVYELSVDKDKLAGIYFNQDEDEIRINLKNDKINIIQGDLMGGVEPYINPNTIRLDLARVGVLKLDVLDGIVQGFTYLGEYYTKY